MAGRPRKKNVDRYPSGRIKDAVREADAMEVAVAQRIRSGVPPEWAKDALAGHQLGRLRLTGEIQATQFEAAQKFQADYERWNWLNGMDRGTARAASLSGMVSAGLPCIAEPDENQIGAARDAFKGACAALQRGLPPDEYHPSLSVLKRLLLQDGWLSGGQGRIERDLGLLRQACNVLARHYRLYGR